VRSSMLGMAEPSAEVHWSFAPLGDAGLLAMVDGFQDRSAVYGLAEVLREQPPVGVVELVCAIDSILICFDPLLTTSGTLRRSVSELLTTRRSRNVIAPPIVEIQVRYGGAYGPDLPDVARTCGLSEDEVIALHIREPMPVLLIGFMPGFPYIGGLPPALHLPRRSTPRQAVAAGSVAIANDQTGIYPSRSPGGWHIIGQTAQTLFDPERIPPALLQAGHLVQFVSLL
jgi:KipI family sensor histidine kinase inhibitor